MRRPAGVEDCADGGRARDVVGEHEEGGLAGDDAEAVAFAKAANGIEWREKDAMRAAGVPIKDVVLSLRSLPTCPLAVLRLVVW